MGLTGISFSYSNSSLQERGLSLIKDHTSLTHCYSMRDFDIPLCYSNSPDGRVPDSVIKFDNTLSASDGIVFAIPEAGGHYCSAFKNVVDWLIVKNRFNSQLGHGYSLSKKPTYILTFTPTLEGSGGRHFKMTKELLESKFGANVRKTIVFNNCWETVLPGNESYFANECLTIKEDFDSLTCKNSSLPDTTSQKSLDADKWLTSYQKWNNQWTM